MRKNENETEIKLSTAFEKITPDVLGSVLSDIDSVQTQKGKVIYMKENRSKVKTASRYIAGIAAALMLVTGGTYVYSANYRVASTVSIDVNPSVEIKANSREKVLAVNALNDDGVVIIGGMDFEGSSMEVTVNALIGSMLRNGYITELANSILITVDDKDSARAAELQNKLADSVNSILNTEAFAGAVISQTLAHTGDTEALAEKHGITAGKAQLIEELIALKPHLTFDELKNMSINELSLMSTLINWEAEAAENSAVTNALMPYIDYVNFDVRGTVSDKAYIGSERALEIALEHANVAKDNVTVCRIDFDYEKGVLVYDVEFYADNHEYDYDISAVDGTIVKHDKEYENDIPKVKSSADNTKKQIEALGDVISADSAKEIALTHAGVNEADIFDYDIELEREHGNTVYEIDFDCGGYEYEYDIDAVTGEILKGEKEWD